MFSGSGGVCLVGALNVTTNTDYRPTQTLYTMMPPSLLVLLVLGVGTAIALPQFPQQTIGNAGTKSGPRAFCNPACPRIFLPVCGSDGKTYPNNCALQYYSCAFRNVSYAYMGECVHAPQCPTSCYAVMAPVCGSDGRTYSNECRLLMASCAGRAVTKVKNGPCSPGGGRGHRSCPVICPYLYAPVCGSDGKTYPNTCTLNAAACKDTSITLRYHRACGSPHVPRLPCPATCRGNYDPVCGSDGSTYGNMCTFERVSCRNPSIILANRGECGAPFNRCPDVCPEETDPVCGSNGITYPNECVFQATTCRNTTVTFTNTVGKCASKPQLSCPVICSAQYKPVCGTDGQTYRNQCILESTACDNPTLITASKGECVTNPDQTPSNTPTRAFTPRPPTRRITTTTTTATPTFTLLPPRLFCPNTCSRSFSPVCGSDGRTYYNRCVLILTACRERRPNTVSYMGQCVRGPLRRLSSGGRRSNRKGTSV